MPKQALDKVSVKKVENQLLCGFPGLANLGCPGTMQERRGGWLRLILFNGANFD